MVEWRQPSVLIVSRLQREGVQHSRGDLLGPAAASARGQVQVTQDEVKHPIVQDVIAFREVGRGLVWPG